LERAAFITELQQRGASELAADYFRRTVIAAFSTANEYDGFRDLVRGEIGEVEFIAIVGTGNWQFSLNPDKNFKEFDRNSDIDVAVISDQMFRCTWEELRREHRSSWYGIGTGAQQQLRRNGENVYSGFVSPTWIPNRTSDFRYRHISMLNRLSNESPGQREVKVMYFKDETEALDYYKRGFTIAKRKVNNR
jgi:hypothetical protein